MTDQFSDVYRFQVAMGLPMPDRPQLLSGDLFDFRRKFLKEEYEEFVEAVERGDLLKAIDGLLDLIYVANGTLAFMGVSPALASALWGVVQAANMRKRRATSDAESKRASAAFDVVKPAGWQSPEPLMLELLRAGGAKFEEPKP